jgi:hypothetical protein
VRNALVGGLVVWRFEETDGSSVDDAVDATGDALDGEGVARVVEVVAEGLGNVVAAVMVAELCAAVVIEVEMEAAIVTVIAIESDAAAQPLRS